MAQSVGRIRRKEWMENLEINPTMKLRKKSSSKMTTSRAELLEMKAEEICELDVESLEAGLKELNITVGSSWSKSRKGIELINAMSAANAPSTEQVREPQSSNMLQPADPSMLMIQAI